MSATAYGVEWVEPADWFTGPAIHLLCPVCGAGYHHHGIVIEYRRDEEDGVTGAFSDGQRIVDAGENPSPRREAVRIEFDGECGHAWALDVIQHKGETFLTATKLDREAEI